MGGGRFLIFGYESRIMIFGFFVLVFRGFFGGGGGVLLDGRIGYVELDEVFLLF